MNNRFAALTIGLTLLGVGCDNGNHDQSVPYAHKNDYQVASCRFGFNEGGQAESEGSPDYRKFLFDKELDYSKIHAIAKASAAATLEFVEKEGVSVFAAHDADSGACAMFGGLPDAPSDLKNKFTSAGSSRKDDTFIVGLFIPKDSHEVPSSSAHPEIGMRRDANRWTLVHEFSHFLFDTDFRRNGGQHSDELKQRYSDSIDAYNSAARTYQRNQTQENFDAVTVKMQGAYAASREIVLRYFAEEMTIETMLRNGVYTAELQYLPFEKRSSYYYIYSSGEAALKELGKFSDELNHLMTEASDKSYWTDYDKLSSTRKDITAFKSQIAEKADDARYEYESAADFVGTAPQVIAPCRHLREAQELTSRTKLGAQ